MFALVILSTILSLFIPDDNPGRERTETVQIHFGLDKTKYDESLMGNGQAVAELARMVERIGQGNLQSIEVIGYASPEGVREHNLYLCRERAKSAKNALRAALPEWARARVITSTGGESWDLFRERVEQDTTISAKTKKRVLAILDDTNIGGGTKKWRLENILGHDPNAGNTYRYIMKSHFRYLRGSNIIVNYYADDAGPEEPEGPSEPEVSLESTAPSEELSELEGPKEPEEAKESEESIEPEGTEPQKAPSNRRPFLGIGTNLIYDATYIPNYGFTSVPSFNVEYYPASSRHYSFGGNVEWPMWRHPDTHKYLQIQNIGLWARRYFKPQEGHFEGLYLSAGANVYRYGIGWDAKGWEGEGLGASAGIGFKKMIGRSRWWFDTGIDLGGLVSKYDPYVYGYDATGWYYYDYGGKPEDFQERQHLMLWFGPTRVYFSIGLDLFCRKR